MRGGWWKLAHSHFKQNSAWPLITVPGLPSRSCRENTHHQKKDLHTRPEPLPWRSLREHMVTGLWDARGLDVLRLLFPVKRFKPLGYDRPLWCLLSIELGNKGEGEGAKKKGGCRGWARCGGDGSGERGAEGVLLEGNHLCGATPEEGGDASNLCFDAATPTKGR